MNQISEEHSDLSANIGTIALPFDQIAGGMLVVGATGCGKSRSVINPVALSYAVATSDPARKPAIVYFATKGKGHEEYVASLPPERQADVIRLTAESQGINLFAEEHWPSESDLAAAVPRFIEDVNAHLSDELGAVKFDLYWERQRIRVLTELAACRPAGAAGIFRGGQAALPLHCGDRLRALLARVDAFIQHVEIERLFVPDEVKAAHKKVRETSDGLREVLSTPEVPEEVAGQALDLMALVRPLVAEKPVSGTVLEAFLESIDGESKSRLNRLVSEWYRIASTTRGCIAADLRGVCEIFGSGPLGRLLGPTDLECLTLESIIDEGKILVVDLPLAESGGAALPALVALKLALYRILLARGMRIPGRPPSRRPVGIVMDECDLIMTRSRTGGEDHFLSKCREYGTTLILGVQSLSLLLGTLRDAQKVSALIANCRTKIWGRSLDPYTTSLASLDCGTTRGQSVQRAPVWHGSALFRAFVTGPAQEEERVVLPNEFSVLAPAEFVLTTSEGAVYRMDLHSRHAAPVIRQLREVSGR
jgi:hypothetical protein